MALAVLTVQELSLWLLLYSFASVGLLIDFGFTPTFVRFVAYARGEHKENHAGEQQSPSKWLRDFGIDEIVCAMKFIYLRLCIGCMLVLGVLGTPAISAPVAQVAGSTDAWLAWAVTIVGVAVTLYNSMYNAYLQGVNQIALYRRWEAASGLISVIAALVCLSLSSSLLFLVIALQVAPIVNIVVNRRLVRRFGFFEHAQRQGDIDLKSPVVLYAWEAAWRSGVGVAATIGAVNMGNILLAQIATATVLAPYLLAQRLVAASVAFAGPIFNTGIPTMVARYKKRLLDLLVRDAGKRLVLTNWAIALCLILIGECASPVLLFLGSETEFVSANVWYVLAIAAVFERTGAMHIQLYSLTNHIVWHVANGITGLVFAVSIYPTFDLFGLVGVACALAVAYGGFYMPYCMWHSYSEYHLKVKQFDLVGSLAPLLLLGAGLTWGYL